VATFYNHDFESGATLASMGYGANAANGGYIADLSNQSGQGLRGSTWGARGPLGGTASARYYAEATLEIAATGRLFSISADFDHADAAYSQYGYSALQLRERGQWFLDLYHGIGSGADRSVLQLMVRNSTNWADDWYSPVGTIVPGTTQRLTLCGSLSSGYPVPDGWVAVYVDGVELFRSASNLVIMPSFGTWNRVLLGAMGRMDNVVITDEGCPAATPPPATPERDVLVANQENCCGKQPRPGASAPTAGAAPVPDKFTAPPPWVAFCTGGGVPPTAPNPVNSEDWSS
jgi:hypothetical protein